jgi:hypothetical protein
MSVFDDVEDALLDGDEDFLAAHFSGTDKPPRGCDRDSRDADNRLYDELYPEG